MRLTKRMLSFLLAVTMLASCFVMTATAEETTAPKQDVAFSDVAGDAIYQTAVKTLNLMGVINGYPDGTFQPDKNVTRAEFTAMLMRTLGLGTQGATSAANLPFSDISDTDTSINWAIPNINTAFDKGIINGYEDGTFRPNDNVAYEEAIKMIVCALGYVCDTTGIPWYSDYLTQAAKLGITENTNGLGKAETPATRACIAQLLYDSLEVKVVEQGKVTDKTILKDYLGYVKNVGVVASDGITSTTAPDVNLRNNEVQISAIEPDTGIYETRTYTTKDDSLRKYLGWQIEFYYKTNGGNIRDLLFYVLVENEAIEIDADQIEMTETTSSQIAYYKSESDRGATRLPLDSANVVIFNGKLLGKDAASSKFYNGLVPKLGSVTMLDSNADGKYDLVNIESYDVYYVGGKIAAEYSIIDDVMEKTSRSLTLDVEDTSIRTTIVDKNGATVSYTSIKEGDIICLAKSNTANGGEVMQKAVVVSETVTGIISGKNAGNFVTISGKEYEYSNAAPWISGNSGALTEPALQDNGTYCLDMNGKIVAYKKNAVVENVMYGYIMGMANTSDKFSEDKLVRILGQDGKENLYLLYDGSRIVGETCNSVSDMVKALELSALKQNVDPNKENDTVQQLIKFTTRTHNDRLALDKIYLATPVSQGAEVQADKLQWFNKLDASVANKVTYNDVSKQLTTGTTPAISLSVNSSTIVFRVPSDRTSFADYEKDTYSNTFRNSVGYQVNAFEVSSTNAAKVIVCYGSSLASEVTSVSSVNVITQDVENMTNSETGDRMDYLQGISVNKSTPNGTLKTWSSSESKWKASKGDIFRAGTGRDGYLKLLEENVIYSPGKVKAWGKKVEGGSVFLTAEFASVLGSVVAKTKGEDGSVSISVVPREIKKGETGADVTTDVLHFDSSTFRTGYMKVLKYTGSGNNLTITDVTEDYTSAIAALQPYADGVANPSKVMIYMSSGRVRLMVILDDAE